MKSSIQQVQQENGVKNKVRRKGQKKLLSLIMVMLNHSSPLATGEWQSSEHSSVLLSDKHTCTYALPGASLWHY